ncbi:MAG: response regulator transcription factor [Velocimicrobium sp.]
MQYILIADDNEDITDILSTYAEKEGFVPLVADDGEKAFRLFQEYNPSIVLLDVMMPKEDGYEVCRKIRSESNVPIILITARGEDFERIMGLDIGADDYIVKPFSPSEVMARVRAILRRMSPLETASTSGNTLSVGNLFINLDEYSITIGGRKVTLTKKEIETMWTLASNPNKVFTRDNLLDSLWGFDYFGDSRTVDSHIKRLRAKLDKLDHPNWTIKTIWGVGYKFEVEGI